MGRQDILGSTQVVLRLAACVFSIAGLVLMAKDQQSVVRNVGDASVGAEVKYSDVTGLVYLLYSNGLVAIYCFVIALISINMFSNHIQATKLGAWTVFLLDQALTYVLLSAVSASAEVLYLSKNGNDKTTWVELCTIYARFCTLLGLSIALSYFSVIALACVSVLSAKHLFGKYAILKRMVKIKALPEL